MKDRAHRQFPTLIFGLTLLALAPGAAAAGHAGPRRLRLLMRAAHR
jgi:hypothetical protein